MKRYDCLQVVAEEMAGALVITTVGGAAAEWNAIRPGDGSCAAGPWVWYHRSPWAWP
jgi:hypothetical protein